MNIIVTGLNYKTTSIQIRERFTFNKDMLLGAREKSMNIQEKAIHEIENKLPNLTEYELKVIRKFSKSIVNQLLNEPLIKMKEMVVDNPNKDELIEIFTQLFSLGEERKETLQEPTVQWKRSDVKNLGIALKNTPIHS